MTNLTDQQQAGIERIRMWYGNAQAAGLDAPAFRLFGPAGTGKTTMAKHIPKALGPRARSPSTDAGQPRCVRPAGP